MLVESTSLHFKAGASDKIYNASIEDNNEGYVVNFSYGRRGSALKSGTKTNSPVTLDEAKEIFSKLIKEKTGKGYKKIEGASENIILVDTNPPDTTTVESKCVLLNPIKENEVENYLKNDDWYAQCKFDGIRFMLAKEGDNVKSYNRRGVWANIPVHIYNGVQKSVEFFVDGELIGENYHVFDILSYEGKDLTELSLKERIPYLDKFFDNVKVESIKKTEYYSGKDKKPFYEKMLAENQEGIVFKNKDAQYYVGRPASGGEYLKYKFYSTCSCVVDDVNKKRSVAIGLYKGKKFLKAGNVTIPANHEIPEKGMVVEVKYLYARKQSGRLYQPVYLGVRQDILPNECQQDQLKYKVEEDSDE